MSQDNLRRRRRRRSHYDTFGVCWRTLVHFGLVIFAEHGSWEPFSLEVHGEEPSWNQQMNEFHLVAHLYSFWTSLSGSNYLISDLEVGHGFHVLVTKYLRRIIFAVFLVSCFGLLVIELHRGGYHYIYHFLI